MQLPASALAARRQRRKTLCFPHDSAVRSIDPLAQFHHAAIPHRRAATFRAPASCARDFQHDPLRLCMTQATALIR